MKVKIWFFLFKIEGFWMILYREKKNICNPQHTNTLSFYIWLFPGLKHIIKEKKRK